MAGMRYAEFARHTMEPLTNKDMDGGLLYLYSTKDISQKAFMFGPTVGIKGKAPSLPGSVIGKAGEAHVTGDTSITGRGVLQFFADRQLASSETATVRLFGGCLS